MNSDTTFEKSRFSPGRLVKRIIRSASVASLVVAAVTIPTVAAQADATILGQWQDAKGRTVVLRDGTWNGSTGFGMQKIRNKHKIYNTNSVRFIIKNPDGGKTKGTRRIYTAYANKKTCNEASHTCTYTDSQIVYAVVFIGNDGAGYVGTYYGVTVNGPLGVMTAYCLNDDRSADCPWWVDTALNNPAGRTASSDSSAASSDGTTTSVDWSYKPLA